MVRVEVVPPEAGFYVRHSSGAAMPGGPDPRAVLPSGSEFIAHAVNGERGITLAARLPGYEDFERTYPLAQGKEYWTGSGWRIGVELRPLGALSTFKHNLRFHPLPIYAGMAGLLVMVVLPLVRTRRTAVALRREKEYLQDRYEQDLVGREVDSYFIESKLGEGSYAQVFLARHKDFGDVFALKILRPYLVEAASLQRIHRELDIGRRLKHPCLVRIVAFGIFHEAPYLVMDYVSGETLAAVLERGPLEVARAVELLALMCEGVEYAHAEGVMHRDLKPDNIMLTASGLKVLDFGVARPSGDWATLTGTGQAIGTPAYMAPEQLLGNPCFASDVYALGVILFMMIRGVLPFGGGDVVAAHLSSPAPPLDSGLLWLDELCASMLEKSVSRRIPSVRSVLQSLRANHLTVRASRETTTMTSQQRNP
ncbi:MAG: serine/threonine protein kinase [Candidatus Eremiobacteraeota bacterium]|nr:serine/threonine protein kinase [Candidatus Eremiobacteraeota bacterium]